MQRAEHTAFRAVPSGFESRRPFQNAGIAKRPKAAARKAVNHRFKSVYPLQFWANADVTTWLEHLVSDQEVVGSTPTIFGCSSVKNVTSLLVAQILCGS